MEVPNEADAELDDVNMIVTGEAEAAPATSQEPANKKPSRNAPIAHRSREASVDMTSDNDNDSYAVSHATNTSPNSGSSASSTTAVSHTSMPVVSKQSTNPPIHEQVAIIQRLSEVPLQEGMVGYVISGQWLQDAQERGSGSKKSRTGASEDVQPPVDNRELIKPIDASWDGLTDERGDKFIPLKPGLMLGQDIEILPHEAWERIISWHGLAEHSPEIKRYCHNTSTNAASENYSFELFPPVFTVMKLPDPAKASAEPTTAAHERTQSPAKILATRSEKWLGFEKRAKEAAGVREDEDVRVWKVIGTLAEAASQPGMITPAQSRSTSPAPTTLPLNLPNRLVIEPKQFVELEVGSKRELVDTTGPGSQTESLTLDAAGLGHEGILVLDPLISGPAGGEWVSDSVPAPARPSSRFLSDKSNVSSGRTSPAPMGVQTRGRAQRAGKPRGTAGLVNLGNTCYMNSALQCVKSVKELTVYFLDERYKKELNPQNPLAHNGEVAKEYYKLLKQMFGDSGAAFSPRNFKATIGKYGASFSGYGQQDSQEFLLFLLDGLQEDLNRIHKKPYIEKPDSTDDMVVDEAALRAFANRCWEIYKARNDSVITDLFAGMYKSTLKCPICSKVSIIFDPFNNLTLQLPIENVWSRRIIFHPLNLPAVDIDVDIDKNATFAQLKEYIGSKVAVDPKRIVLSEVYQSRFYKMFKDNTTIGEDRIQASDIIVSFEVDQIPSNYPDPRPRRAGYGQDLYNDDTHDLSETKPEYSKHLLVPIFHRYPKETTSRGEQFQLFGIPSYVVISEEEARDEERILKKVLARVATMTTNDILNQANDSDEESDTVIMNAEDADSSSDSRIKAQSIQSEEGVVDVSMRDTEEEVAPRKSYPPRPRIKKGLPSALDPERPLPAQLKSLFTMKAFGKDEFIPTAWNKFSMDGVHVQPLAARAPQPRKRPAEGAKDKLKRRIANGGSDTDETSEDELATASPPAPAATVDSSDEDDALPPVQQLKAPTTDRFGNDLLPDAPAEPGPLIRLGEGIVCDWDMGSYQALFSDDAEAESDGFRGTSTWSNPRTVVPDPAVDQRRTTRAARKRNGVSLEDCLDEFDKEEILSENDAWYCPRCKEHRRASKRFEIWKVPDILVIHLKRFSSQRRLQDKLDLNVEFPVEGLDLTKRVLDGEGKELIFDLFAVDNHYGGLGGGHYTAYAKSFNDGSWYDYNDAVATKVSDLGRLNSSAAYMLFYRRRTSRAALGGPFFERILDPSAAESDAETSSAPGSRNHSPSSHSGEGQRLADFSRTGSSSASHAVGAAHPARGGGHRTTGAAAAGTGTAAARAEEDEEEALPPYSGPAESMDVDDRPPGLFGGPVVTWKGFGNMVPKAERTDGDDDDNNSSTGATGNHEDDDDRSMRSQHGSDPEWIQPGTPLEQDVPLLDGEPPQIRIDGPDMDPGDDAADQPVAEVRLDAASSEKGKTA